MIPLITLCVVVFGILGFRVYRLIEYGKEANSNTSPKEKRIAYINFGIHLIVCLTILYLIAIVAYGMILMSKE